MTATRRTAAAATPRRHSSNYPIDQGITQQSREHVERIDLAPYVPAVKQHHVGSVMPSYSSMDFTDDGLGNPVKMHANRELIQGWLKDKQGFDGFVISDYHGIDQIPLATRAEKVTAWVNAGGDMAMEPDDYQAFETTLVSEVQAGRVTTRADRRRGVTHPHQEVRAGAVRAPLRRPQRQRRDRRDEAPRHRPHRPRPSRRSC